MYDALNVLMAMDIIVKDKKDISWQGLPSAPHAQLEKLKEERAALRQKILNQQAYLLVCQTLKPCKVPEVQRRPAALHGLRSRMQVSSEHLQECALCHFMRAEGAESLRVPVCRRPASSTGRTGICCCDMQTGPPACWPRLRARVRGPRP